MLVINSDLPEAIPSKTNCQKHPDMPTDYHPLLRSALHEHRAIFRKKLRHTSVAEHVIETGDSFPVKVPARPIPFYFKERVHTQLQEMADAGIIQPNNSPWCAPAVYVPKANGEVCICVDFVQLNKVTKKDSYPVPHSPLSAPSWLLPAMAIEQSNNKGTEKCSWVRLNNASSACQWHLDVDLIYNLPFQ